MDRVKSNVVVQKGNEERNILYIIKTKANGLVTSCVGTAFCNTLFKKRRKERIDETGRGRRKYKLIPNDLNETKRGSLDCTVWRTCFERDCGPDTKQTKHNDDDDDVRKRDLPSFTHYPNTWTEGLRRTTKTPRIVQIQLSPLLNTILRFANIPPSYHAKKIICPFKPISKYGYCP